MVYKDTYVFKAIEAAQRVLFEYFNSCHDNFTYSAEHDYKINNYILPYVREIVYADMQNGGSCDIKMTSSQNQPVLWIDNMAFCGYQALDRTLENRIGFTKYAKENSPVGFRAACNEIDKMADAAAKNVEPVKFVDEFHKAQQYKDVEALVRSLNSHYTGDGGRIGVLAQKLCSYDMPVDHRDDLALVQFIGSNTPYKAAYEDGHIKVGVEEVYNYKIKMELSRPTEQDYFEAVSMNIKLYFDEGRTSYSMEDIKLNGLGKEIGKKFTEYAYAEKLEKERNRPKRQKTNSDRSWAD